MKHQIQDHERDVVIFFGRTFAAAKIKQLTHTIPCQAGKAAEGLFIPESLSGFGAPKAHMTSAEEEEER